MRMSMDAFEKLSTFFHESGHAIDWYYELNDGFEYWDDLAVSVNDPVGLDQAYRNHYKAFVIFCMRKLNEEIVTPVND